MNSNFQDVNVNKMNDGTMCKEQPVYECPEERICDRYIMHDVEHIMPVHTKIINHHIYKHSYRPCFSVSECDVCENIFDACPNKNFY